MTLSQFLYIMRARWNVAMLILVVTVSLAMGVSLMLPKQYTATATLLVDQMRPDPVAGTPYAASPSPAFMATQVDVLRSERVAQNVVRKLGLANDPGVRELWMKESQGIGNFDAWLVDHIQYWLDVKPSRDSNVISVSFKDPDPDRAASIANLFIQSYLDLLLELRVDPAKQYASFFESRAKDLRANLERAQAKLTAYQRDKGVVIASEGQIDVETARLNELSTQLVALQAVASETGSRESQARAGGSDRLQEVVNNPNLSALRAEIARAEAKLQELNSRLGDNHPQVIESRANIASLRSRLATETSRVTGSLGVSNSINRQREAEIRAALEAQRSRVMRMRTAREEGAVLLRDVEAAQRAYDMVAAKLNQSNLEGRTTQSNAYLLAQAVPPFAPSSPKLLRNAVLSIFAGLVLAVAAAILLEYVDRRVRTDEEIPEVLGLPLLGVLPKPGGKGHFASRRIPLVTSRSLLRRLPAPGRRA